MNINGYTGACEICAYSNYLGENETGGKLYGCNYSEEAAAEKNAPKSCEEEKFKG